MEIQDEKDLYISELQEKLLEDVDEILKLHGLPELKAPLEVITENGVHFLPLLNAGIKVDYEFKDLQNLIKIKKERLK